MRKALMTLLVGLAMVSAVSATQDVYNESDTVVNPDSIYTTDAFTGDNLTSIEVDASLDTNESLEATLKGFNSSEQTSNQSFSLSDGVTNKSITSFSENTTTFTVDFNASDGDVTLLDVAIEGDAVDSDPAGVAGGGGGWLTGNFFTGIPVVGQAFQAVGNAFNNAWTWLVEAWTP